MEVLRHLNKVIVEAFSPLPTPLIFAFAKNGRGTELYFYLRRML